MSLKINTSIFREYDIRGIAGRDLDASFAELLGVAYAKYISDRKPVAGRNRLTISVGWDCRLTSDDYSSGLIKGLTRGGLNVIKLGVCPTPGTYFSLFHLNTDGGIMVTGSHNPGDYNGFKVCVGRDTLHGSQIQDLRKIMEALNAGEKFAPTPGDISHHPILNDYIDYLVKHAKGIKPKKVVIDAGNGTAGNVAPEIFKRLGANVISLYCELDGHFPNHHPDPTVQENLKDLVAKVKSERADFGVAFDGDSDRIGLVDETGRIMFGDELMIVLARSILKTNPGATIISEVKSSHRLYQDIAKKGGVPIMWKTGHSLIKSKMKETKAALAGEMSGHIFFADRYFGYDDAIYAAVRVYEIASETQGPVSSLIADLTPVVATPEIRVDCVEEKKFQLVEEVKKRLAAKYTVNTIDGVRVDFGDSWGLVRASNTQPVLVLRFEAPTQARLTEARKIVETALHESAAQIGHPAISMTGGGGH